MIADGASSPADLLVFPFLFGATFLLVLVVSLVWRRIPLGRSGREPKEPPPLGVPAAVGRLRKAGLDPDELLGPWLLAEREPAGAGPRQGRDPENTPEFN